MKKFFIMALYLCPSFYSHTGAAEPSPYDHIVRVGQSIKLKSIVNAPIFASREGVFTIQAKGQFVKLTAKKTGRIELIHGSQHLNLLSLSSRAYESFQSLLQKVIPIPQMFIEYREKHIHLVGNLVRGKDYLELLPLIRTSSLPVVIQLKVDSDQIEKLRGHMQKRIAALVEDGKFRVHLDRPWRVILPSTKTEKIKKLRSQFKKMGLKLVMDSQWKNPEKMVQVTLHFTEINSKKAESLGLDWISSSGFNLLPHPISSKGSTGVDILLRHNKGLGRTLSRPVIVMKNKKTGSFHVGGEIAVETKSVESAQVQWKSYGVTVNATPKIYKNGLVHLNIEVTLSHPDHSQKLTGSSVPGLKRSRFHSKIETFSGQTLVLSGLLHHSMGKNNRSLPGLSQIPLFGELFKSSDYEKNESELYLFVTPTVFEARPNEHS